MEWLGQYLPGGLTGESAGDALTNGGLPVEEMERIGDDTVIDVEVTSNRGDCLSHVGVARELGALLRRDVTPPAIADEPGSPETPPATVRIDAQELCSYYSARVIRNVKVGPSPGWMKRRLEAIGVRSINNVVDVTNYVMFELGQPLHAFDYDKLAGQQIVVRRAKKGEKLTSIDGRERELTDEMLVIADADKPVALAGVMGGLNSEVTEGTTTVLLESARFDPLVVRKTARGLAMMSDSSYRFERGIPRSLPPLASARAARLIVETAGGEMVGGLVAVGDASPESRQLLLRMDRLRRLLGVDWETEKAMEALHWLGLSPVRAGNDVRVTVPPWRLDLNIEVDLIEEVARVVGYEQIPVRDELSLTVSPADPVQRATALINEVLVGAGYFEAITFSFASDALAGDFTPAEARGLPRAAHAVRKADGQLRPSLLPGLLEAVRRNETGGIAHARLYETGSTFWTTAEGKVDERRRIGLVGSEDLREVRGVVEAILRKLDAQRPVRVIPDDRAGYAKGAAARVEWGGQPIGYLGKIDAGVLDKLSLRSNPAAAELELAPLIAGAQLVPQLQPLPRFPAIRRDLSLIVAETTRFEQIAAVVAQSQPDMLEDLEYVTTYRGKPLDRGQKSVTITLVFRSPTTTLTSDEVETSVQRVVDVAKRELGATLRA